MSDFDTKMTEIDLKLQIHALKQENAALRANSKEVFEYEAQMDELKSENAMLKAWKESALINEKELDAPATAKLLGVKLGESFYKTIAEKVPQLVAENAALRSELAEVKKAFAPIFVRELHGECIMLERENAALREDKERLDLLLTNKHCKLSFCWEWLHWTPQQVRCALDAERVKRKEAQP